MSAMVTISSADSSRRPKPQGEPKGTEVNSNEKRLEGKRTILHDCHRERKRLAVCTLLRNTFLWPLEGEERKTLRKPWVGKSLIKDCGNPDQETRGKVGTEPWWWGGGKKKGGGCVRGLGVLGGREKRAQTYSKPREKGGPQQRPDDRRACCSTGMQKRRQHREKR